MVPTPVSRKMTNSSSNPVFRCPFFCQCFCNGYVTLMYGLCSPCFIFSTSAFTLSFTVQIIDELSSLLSGPCELGSSLVFLKYLRMDIVELQATGNPELQATGNTEARILMPTLDLDRLAIKILAIFPNSPNFWSAKIFSYTVRYANEGFKSYKACKMATAYENNVARWSPDSPR